MSGQSAERAETVRIALSAVLPRLLRQWLPAGEQQGSEYVALNPRRPDRNLGSFRIDTLTGEWRDHAIDRGGKDAISLHAYIFGGNYRSAFAALAAEPLVRAAIATGARRVAAKPAKGASAPDRMAVARRIYQRGSEIIGTAAEHYLRSRGLLPGDAWTSLRASLLRYPGHGRYPALIAPFADPNGDLQGIHRTYLRPTGAKLDVDLVRLTLGNVRGCAIRLGEPDNQLIVCEGLEDGLTLVQQLKLPVWVAGGASFMSTMEIPDRVEALIIAADNDRAGEVAAQRAAERHYRGFRDVRIMRPSPEFKDFNDQLRGVGRGS